MNSIIRVCKSKKGVGFDVFVERFRVVSVLNSEVLMKSKSKKVEFSGSLLECNAYVSLLEKGLIVN